MNKTAALVITTIAPPTRAIVQLAQQLPGWMILAVGDEKTPADWTCSEVTMLSLQDQLQSDSLLAARLPMNHYVRKNMGYLAAMQRGAEMILETDDDNFPYETFGRGLQRKVTGTESPSGWVNVYTHFSEAMIWPRGFPLELIRASLQERFPQQGEVTADCEIQQYLADGDPDVDAIYRLLFEDDIKFADSSVILAPDAVCPFNSQNTLWWPESYPLLYLPSFCSFRMTDIWRSFVAQACLRARGGRIAFHGPTVRQIRNPHSLIRDFDDEVPGYLKNQHIVGTLFRLPLSPDPAATGVNLRHCYEALVAGGLLPEDELSLVDLWLAELPF